MGLLDGRKALVFGVANDHSIAWGIAKAFHDEGARRGLLVGGEPDRAPGESARGLDRQPPSWRPATSPRDEEIGRVMTRWHEE